MAKSLKFIPLLFIFFIFGCSMSDSNVNPKEPTSKFENTYWKIVTIMGKKVEVLKNMREPYLVFHSTSNKISGYTGCNKIMGSYKIDGNNLSIGKVATTKMMCIQVANVEIYLLKVFKSVKRFEINGEKMKLLDKDGKVLGEFRAVYLN